MNTAQTVGNCPVVPPRNLPDPIVVGWEIVMNELKHLIGLVRNSNQPVRTIVLRYVRNTTWSPLVDEFHKLSQHDKARLYKRLEMERRNVK